MKKSFFIGIIFTILFGTLLHFTYHFSNNNPIVALFSAVNECTWEHLKLLFFPYVIYMIFEYYILENKIPNFTTAKLIGLLSGLITIPIIFYSYTALLGTNYLILDIITFILGVTISYIISYKLYR